MNYQENKNNHHMLLVYIILSVVFVATVIFAVLMIRGYRFNVKEQNIEAYGVLQVKTFPSGANIKINDRELGFLDGKRLDVAEGQHMVTVSRDGYQTWQDKVMIRGGKVKWLNVRLFPDKLEQTLVKNYPALLGSFEAPNHRFMINHLAKNQFELVDLTAKEPKFIAVNLAEYFTEASKYDFEFLDWNLARDSLLFQDKKSATKQTIMINYLDKDPRAVVDLTARYANQKPVFANYKITGAKGTVMWALEANKLYRLDLAATDKPAELIADGVKAFAAIDENKIAFSQLDPNDQQHPTKVNLYNYKLAQPILFDRVLNGVEPKFNALRFSDNDYLVYSVDRQLSVFKADGEFYTMTAAKPEAKMDRTKTSLLVDDFLAKNPRISKIYSKFFAAPADLRVGINPRFVTLLVDNRRDTQTKGGQVAWENSDLFVYDIEDDESSQYTYHDQAAQPDLVLKWLDNVMLWNRQESGMRVRYFNGRNSRILTGIHPLYGVQFDAGEGNLYYFTKTADGKIDLMKLKTEL